jgi:SAM-dependent methyltransferase
MSPLTSRRKFVLSAAAATGLALLPFDSASAQAEAAMPRLDVPYVPTPQEVVDGMLALARVGKDDYLIDLGCGDGRIVVSAAHERGARALGIDLNPERIAEANANARKAGVQGRTSFRVADLFETDLSAASVVSLYLLPDVNLKLRPKLWEQLKPGSRVVSHAFDMGPDWPPQRTQRVKGSMIYLWTITAAQKAAASGSARQGA